jgi:hypothetical protein
MFLLMAIIAMPFTACSNDDDELKAEEENLHNPESDEDQTEVLAYDALEWLQGCLAVVDENGEVVSSERVLSHNKILLYTFSEEFYKYVVAQELKDENADFFAGIAPSNFCYTNIRNGFGAFAGVSRQETDWITPEFIEKNR